MTVQAVYAGDRRYSVSGVGYGADGEILLNGQPANLTNAPALRECLRAGLLCNDSHLQEQDGQANLTNAPALRECLRAGLLCNDSHLQEQDGQCVVVGDPTEGALIVAAHKAGLTQQVLEQEMPRLDTIPFESEFQYMATLHKSKSDTLIYLKGSTESILKRCDQRLNTEGRFVPLDRTQVEREADAMAEQGLRVLAFAKKPVAAAQHSLDHPDFEQGLVFIGLQGMIDPPRPEAIAAEQVCQSAGIHTKLQSNVESKLGIQMSIK